MPQQQPKSSFLPTQDEYTEDRSLQDVTEDSEELFYGTEELLDALPRVWSRSLVYVLVIFVAVGVPWSMVSKIDETGSARGRLEPLGAVRKLDSITGGRVANVKVKAGDKVRAGQILVELDNSIIKPELERTKEKLTGLENQVSQLELLKKQMQLTANTQQEQNKSQVLEKRAQVSQAMENLASKQSSYNLQQIEKQALVNQAKQQIPTFINERKLAKVRLDIDKTQVGRFSKLINDGAVSYAQIDEIRKQLQESTRIYDKAGADIEQAKLRLAEQTSRYQTTMNQLESDIEQAKLQLREQRSSYQSVVNAGKLALSRAQEQIEDLQRQINSTKSQIAQTRKEITSLKIQMQQLIVRSPIDGVVFELPISKPGEVLQAGQRIARVAPEGSGFVLKAQMPVKETGFVKMGMPVKIKFDAYPFQEYGIIEGKVSWISPDSKAQPQAPNASETYELKISLDNQGFKNSSQRVLFTAGQTAEAEVIVRQRRVIDFLLDPFKKLHKGGLEI